MGFGILFAGYFLLLNFAYYGFTDAIASVIMLYALYKLSGINRGFRNAAIASVIFTVFGLFELVISVIGLFYGEGLEGIVFYSALIRHVIIATTSALMLIGMREIADEVGIGSLARKCNKLAYATVAIYLLNIALETGELGSFIDIKILVYAAVLSIALTLAVTVASLSAIFNCYSQICMPEDNTPDYTEPKSRFAFVNEFRAHQEEKQKEYAEYKLNKFKKRMEKAKQKENKNADKK
ncbi:MAG: hypothetical protein IJY69_05535 [Clostridia bacterium]|nr:hypothetical protein [Clostridia bacterium]